MGECEMCGDFAPTPVSAAGETRALCRECELTEDVAYWQRRCDALTRRIEALERVAEAAAGVARAYPDASLPPRDVDGGCAWCRTMEDDCEPACPWPRLRAALDAIDAEESDG